MSAEYRDFEHDPFEAMRFARQVHKDQKRRCTNTPYSEHLAEVVALTATVTDDSEVLQAAWLHDCMEDQGVTQMQLVDQFGLRVMKMVVDLSDMEQGNRAMRKMLSRERLAASAPEVQTIKCADIISNTPSIVQHEPRFARLYLSECRALLDVLTKADDRLRWYAYEELAKGERAQQEFDELRARLNKEKQQ